MFKASLVWLKVRTYIVVTVSLATSPVSPLWSASPASTRCVVAATLNVRGVLLFARFLHLAFVDICSVFGQAAQSRHLAHSSAERWKRKES